jgi:hypothetical protein
VAEIPEEAVQAARRHAQTQALLWQYIDEQDIRGLLSAAAPILAAHERADERRKTAEQIAGAIAGTPKPEEAYWRVWAARIARQTGEARA